MELGAEAIRRSGDLYAQLLPPSSTRADLVAGIRDFFAGAADTCANRLRGRLPDRHRRPRGVERQRSAPTGLRRGLRRLDRGRDGRFVAEGLDEGEARRLVTAMIAALEWAFVLCRALRSTEPMEHAASVVVEAVRPPCNSIAPEPSQRSRTGVFPATTRRSQRQGTALNHGPSSAATPSIPRFTDLEEE